MTRHRTERGRGESVHHGGPHAALRRRDAILAWSTRRSDLPSGATSLGRRMPTHRNGKWDATALFADSLHEGNGCGCRAAAGDAAGSGVRSTPRGHVDFLQRHTSLGYEIVCPVRCDRRTACSGYLTGALAARLRPRLVEPALSLSIAYLAPQPQLAASGWGRARARRGGWGSGAAASSSPSHSTRTIRSAAWPSHSSISGRAGERRATAR